MQNDHQTHNDGDSASTTPLSGAAARAMANGIQSDRTIPVASLVEATAVAPRSRQRRRLLLGSVALALSVVLIALVASSALRAPAVEQSAARTPLPSLQPASQIVPADWERHDGQGIRLWMPPGYQLTSGAPKAAQIRKIPRPWETESEEDDSSLLSSMRRLMVLKTEGVNYAAAAALNLPVPSGGYSLDELLDLASKTCACGGTVENRSTVALLGGRAGRAELATKQGIRIVLYVLEHEKQIWVILYMVNQEQYDQRLPDFERSIQTLQLGNSSASCLSGDPQAAIAEAEEMLAYNPEDYWARLVLVCAGIQQGDYSRAWESARAAQGLSSNAISAYLQHTRGWSQQQHGAYAASVQSYSRAIELRPNNPAYYAYRAYAQFRLAKYDLALQDYNQALARERDLANLFMSRGWTQNYRHDYPAAIEDISAALRRTSDEKLRWNALYVRGSLYYSQREYEQAIADFSALLELDGESSSGYWYRALAHKELAQYDQALKDFNLAIQYGQESADLYYNRALVYQQRGAENHKQGDFEQSYRDNMNAIEDISAAITQLEDPSAAWYVLRGNLYREAIKVGAQLEGSSSDLYQSFVDDYSAALELEPESEEALEGRATGYFQLGQYKLAIEDYRRLILKNDLARYYNGRAAAHIALKQYDLAIQDSSQAVVRDTVSAQGYAQRGYARFMLEPERSSLALYDLDQAIALSPHEHSFYHKRSLVYLGIGAQDKAIADLKLAYVEARLASDKATYEEQLRELGATP